MSVFSELGESKVFKKEDVLLPEHLPEMLPHRESQIKILADNLLPASKGRNPQNIFLYGPPGIGKTHVTKFVFREFENFSKRVKCVYLNCWDFKSAVSILSQVVIELGFPVQRRGWSKDEILERLKETTEKVNKSLVLCLDEVDQLEQEALYDLLRINQYVKNPVGLVFISNNAHVFAEVEPRVRSSLNVDEIEFKSYTVEEMKEILQKRAEKAFYSVESGVVAMCANHAVQKGGDVRVGLECLVKAGRTAEQESETKVRVEHVKKILSGVKEVKSEIVKDNLNEHEKNILSAMEKRKNYSSGEAYEAYCKSVEDPVSERMFRVCISHLGELGLVEVHEKRGVRGNTRSIERVK